MDGKASNHFQFGMNNVNTSSTKPMESSTPKSLDSFSLERTTEMIKKAMTIAKSDNMDTFACWYEVDSLRTSITSYDVKKHDLADIESFLLGFRNHFEVPQNSVFRSRKRKE